MCAKPSRYPNPVIGAKSDAIETVGGASKNMSTTLLLLEMCRILACRKLRMAIRSAWIFCKDCAYNTFIWDPQPLEFYVVRARLWKEKSITKDVTAEFIARWREVSFDTLRTTVLIFSGTPGYVLDVEYQRGVGETHRILYEEAVVYPPYKRGGDERIQDIQFHEKDVRKANIVRSVSDEPDTFVTWDMTTQVLSLRGPGGIFYHDTEVPLNTYLIAKWLSLLNGGGAKSLYISWTTGENTIIDIASPAKT